MATLGRKSELSSLDLIPVIFIAVIKHSMTNSLAPLPLRIPFISNSFKVAILFIVTQLIFRISITNPLEIPNIFIITVSYIL